MEASAGGTLNVNGASNSGVVEANGGTVEVSGSLNQTSGGVVKALNGSVVELVGTSFNGTAGAIISGGALSAQSGGSFETAADDLSELDNVTISAGATFTGEDGSETYLAGTIVNNGVLSLDSGTGSASFEVYGVSALLTGTGVVQLNASANNSISAGENYGSGASGALTIGASQTIEGSGAIEAGYNGSVVNNGTIDADQATPLSITSSDGIVTNNGLMEATAGGTLNVNGASNSGTVEANGGTVVVESANLVNKGTVLATSGRIDVQGAITGTGTDTISGASTLEFDSTVAGNQTALFTGSGGLLDLTDPTGFAADISGFAAIDSIGLSGQWAFSHFSENSGGTLGTLTLAEDSTLLKLQFIGDYTRAEFNIHASAMSTTVGYA